MAVETYTTVEALRRSMGLKFGSGPYPEDPDIELAIAGGSRAIDTATGRRFWVDDDPSARVIVPHGKTLWNQGESLLILPDIATVDALLVEFGQVGAVTWSLFSAWEAQYRDPGIPGRDPINGLIQVGAGWPCGAGERVRVTATWGWPAVPKDIEMAGQILARRLFKRKDSPGGILGSQEWVTNLAKKDPDVQSLIQPFELPGFG